LGLLRDYPQITPITQIEFKMEILEGQEGGLAQFQGRELKRG
jgi:hypothetical protein